MLLINNLLYKIVVKAEKINQDDIFETSVKLKDVKEVFEESLLERNKPMITKLLRDIAVMWVDDGGDVEGIDWAYRDLKKAIQEEITRRSVENETN